MDTHSSKGIADDPNERRIQFFYNAIRREAIGNTLLIHCISLLSNIDN